MDVNRASSRTSRHQQHPTSHGCRGTRSRGLIPLLAASIIVCSVGALPVGEQQHQHQKQSIAAPSARAPAEGLEFPNTAQIPGDLTEQLGVDGFFSLWFVFLDDDVFTSGNRHTSQSRLIFTNS